MTIDRRNKKSRIEYKNFSLYQFSRLFTGNLISKIINLSLNLEKKNLNTVILLNPKNEEAIFNLAKLILNDSDYNGSKKLIDQLLKFCKNLCAESKKLKIEIEKSQIE